MNISDAGLDIIKEFEGYKDALPDGSCRAYRCVVGHRNGAPVYDGKWTIGWGCTEGVHPGLVWTRQQAEAGYRREMAKFEAVITRLVKVPINQNQFDALVSLVYNIGEGGLAGSTVLRRLNAGDYDGAAAAFAMWNKAKAGGRGPLVEMRGLTIRRAREAALFRTPVDAADEPMPQAVEETKPTNSEYHFEMHENLKSESWFYLANQVNKKTIVGAVAAALAFVQDHAVEIAAGGLVAVILFELVQYYLRTRAAEA